MRQGKGLDSGQTNLSADSEPDLKNPVNAVPLHVFRLNSYTSFFPHFTGVVPKRLLSKRLLRKPLLPYGLLCQIVHSHLV